MSYKMFTFLISVDIEIYENISLIMVGFRRAKALKNYDRIKRK